MKLKKEFITHVTGGEQVMVSVDNKLFSGLVRSNETAAFIVNCLKEETTVAGIVEKLYEKYEAPKEVLEQDVNRIVEQLRGIRAIDE